MAEKIKTFEMLIEDDLVDSVFAISMVDQPAIETDYILLSKDGIDRIDINLEKADIKRKVVTGPALIPDLVIPRKGYNIIFSKDTIRKISENFMQSKQYNVTIQHQQNVNKVNLIENWIVEDNTKDKATALGFDVPNGTWMVSFKVNDDNLWAEYLETNILRGFSIEGQFSQKEINLSEEDTDQDLADIVLQLAYSTEDLDQRYIWRLGSGGESEENCPSCKAFNNKVKTLREWINTAIPAVPNGKTIAGELTSYPHSPYGTFCEGNCTCTLVKVADNRGDIKRRIVKKPF